MPKKKVVIFRFNSYDKFQLTSASFLVCGKEKHETVIEFPKNYPKIRILTNTTAEEELSKLNEFLEKHFVDWKDFVLVLNMQGSIEELEKELLHLTKKQTKRKVSNLKTPLLQVALDLLSAEKAYEIASSIPPSDQVLVEAGTPLIKAEGIRVINIIKDARPNSFTVADLKTLDTGALEVSLAENAGAEIVSVSGLANISTLNDAIRTARKLGIWIYIDMMNVKDPLELLSQLEEAPDVVLLHRGIDMEFSGEEHRWDIIKEIKAKSPSIKIAVAGGINLDTAKSALDIGADIIIVGRAITASENVEKSVKQFLNIINS